MDEPMKQCLSAGLFESEAEKVVALKAPMEARGLNWSKLIGLLAKVAPAVLPAVIEVITGLTKPDDPTPPPAI